MTRQEMFDKAARGVIAQGRPSIDDKGNCVYRGDDSLRCAVGHLIPDDRYRGSFDLGCWTVLDLVEGGLFDLEDHNFLQDLQRAHDGAADEDANNFLAGFRECMRDLADEWGLSPAVLDEPPAAAQFATRMETGK